MKVVSWLVDLMECCWAWVENESERKSRVKGIDILFLTAWAQHSAYKSRHLELSHFETCCLASVTAQDRLRAAGGSSPEFHNFLTSSVVVSRRRRCLGCCWKDGRHMHS